MINHVLKNIYYYILNEGLFYNHFSMYSVCDAQHIEILMVERAHERSVFYFVFEEGSGILPKFEVVESLVHHPRFTFVCPLESRKLDMRLRARTSEHCLSWRSPTAVFLRSDWSLS